MASDGQVTLGNTVIKARRQQGQRAGKGKVLVGFAGGAADALALFDALRGQARGVPAATSSAPRSSWPGTGAPTASCAGSRRMLIVADREQSLLVSGTGDVIEPDDGGLLAIGSGGAATPWPRRGRCSRTPSCRPREIAERGAARSPAEICIYTNDQMTIEEL